MIARYILLLIVLSGCSSKKSIEKGTKSELSYSKPYYLLISFQSANEKPMKMGGIGDNFNVNEYLMSNSIESLLDRFYKDLAYAPHILNIEGIYKRQLECLGYSIKWYDKYYVADIYSQEKTKHQSVLKDGTKVTISVHEILDDLNIEFTTDFKDCITASSIEFNLESIPSLRKMAVYLD